MHISEVFVTRNKYVGIGYASQLKQIVILRVSTALGNVAKRIVLAAGKDESGSRHWADYYGR